jgi:hypothetical protein
VAAEQTTNTAPLSPPPPPPPPRSTISHAPTARLPTHPSDTAAPNASSLSATRAPTRNGARSKT